jgi:hypothetical protein
MKQEIKQARQLVASPTPPAGNRIAGAGAKLTAMGAAGLTTAVAAPDLPDVPDSWLQAGRIVLGIVSAITGLAGLIITGVGKGQTDTPAR